MNWSKKGIIFNADNHTPWAYRGAMIPTPVEIDPKTIRLFLTFKDKEGIGRVGYIDLEKNNLFKIKGISSSPLIDIGNPGTFDDNGVLLCSVTKTEENNYHFYYAGFEIGTKTRYRLFSGLSITDQKFKLIKKFNAPVLDRTEGELHFRGGPFCKFENGTFKMWYVGGSGWEIIAGKSMPVYEIKYVESNDGINWPKEGKTCIAISKKDEHGFGRPYVIKHQGIFKMFYSIRKKKLGYRLGYAESIDGIQWERKDHLINLDISKNGFDNEIICYSAVMEINGKLVMFYNGNNFGDTGVGLAVLEE